jgi:DNA-binding MarR family transcriptional regulator
MKKTSKISLSKNEYETLASFRCAARKMLARGDEAARQLGITPQQNEALLVLQGFPGRDYATIGELAEWLLIRHHSAVGLVDRLEAQGLVKRKQSTEDRRTVYVHLTAKGRNLIGKMGSIYRDELSMAGPDLRKRVESAASS